MNYKQVKNNGRIIYKSCIITDIIYKKKLPQIWMEDDKFIIESSSFRYVIDARGDWNVNKDDLKLLFKLCRRFKSDAINQTYAI